MIIREAEETEEARAAVWAMLEPVFRAGETYCIPRDIDREAALGFWFGAGHRVFVAGPEEAGPEQMVGTYFLRPNKAGPGAHIANAAFVTAPEAAGRGVAWGMLTHALETARAAGYRAMQFNAVVSTNSRAIALWERAGFAGIGRIPEAFRLPDGAFADLLVMHRVL